MDRRDFFLGAGASVALVASSTGTATGATSNPDTYTSVKVSATGVLSGQRKIRVIAPPGGIKGLTLRGCDDVLIDDQLFTPETAGAYALTIDRTTNVKLINTRFVGLWDKTQDARGYIHKNGSDGLLVQNSTFTGLGRCGVHDHSQNIKLLVNRLIKNRSEGFNFVGVQDVEIGRNVVSDFAWTSASGTSDHPDVFQFWTNRATRANERIYIHDNLHFPGQGKTGQFILMGNGVTGTKAPIFRYKDVRIENNRSLSMFSHGISIYQGDGIIVKNNTILIPPQFFPNLAARTAFKNQIRLTGCDADTSRPPAVIEKNIANSISKNGAPIKTGNSGNYVVGITTEPEYRKYFVDLISWKPRVNAGAFLLT